MATLELATVLARKLQCARVEYIDLDLPPKDSEAIAKWYDALSKDYDELYGEEQNKKHSKVLEILGNKEFEIIVDVGCGTGKLLGLIAPKCQLALGVDLSAQMLEKAKNRTRDARVQLILADATHLPLRNKIADRVISISMTEHTPKSDGQLGELTRIATENASMIVTVFGARDQPISRHLTDMKIELVASLSNREQLYATRRA